MQLEDTVLDINITANRGDAMSILGIAREAAALSRLPLNGPARDPVPARIRDVFPVHLDAPDNCPRFAGRVIRGLDNRRQSPLWMRERLRRAGLRSISPLVDVTNYVMLELGQPMHAYDLRKLTKEIRVRQARPGERLTLLDGRTIELDSDVLVIADAERAIGMAGIMGGELTSVSEDTSDHRPAPAGGPSRDSRPGRGRRVLGAVRRGLPDSCARTGANESFVTWPAHTRSHSAASTVGSS